MEFSLIIPLWNEEKNIDQLVAEIAESGLTSNELKEVILVNNGSADATPQLIDKWSRECDWIKAVHLKENLNYGGGVYEGFGHATTEIVSYIPGDLQVSIDDLKKIWERYQKESQVSNSQHIFVKGNRTVRLDPFQTRFVSRVYTFLANMILGVRIRDVNGLPKMFHKALLLRLPAERMKTFVFDMQLIYTARRFYWKIFEEPVTFHARREGVSSWSGKRFQVYFNSLRQMFRLRKLEYPKI